MQPTEVQSDFSPVTRVQGTASLGLLRYYVLIEGPRADGSDDLIVELKQARPSALAGLAPPHHPEICSPGERIVHAHAVQLAHGDAFYGSVPFEGTTFVSRERSPCRVSVDLKELSKCEWKEYARICGACLAHAHALTDEAGAVDADVEPKIVDAIRPAKLFIDDIVRFAEEAAERLCRDHQAFCSDYQLGAFTTVDVDDRDA